MMLAWPILLKMTKKSKPHFSHCNFVRIFFQKTAMRALYFFHRVQKQIEQCNIGIVVAKKIVKIFL